MKTWLTAICYLLFVSPQAMFAEDQPVPIVAGGVSGHVHPSICRTKDGALVVVFQGKNVLMGARSVDDGQTWDKPAAIETTAKRPEGIREVKKFEIYPGTVDTLPDDRVLVTWNYIADDKATDGYYERALAYTMSADQGRTWSEQRVIGPIDGKHLGAVRHNVLPWPDGGWLLPLRVGPPRLYDPKTGELAVFPLVGPDGKQHEFQQILRTTNNTLLAMGPVLLRSTDQGKSWSEVNNFPPAEKSRDNLEGRYLTALPNDGVLVTWGVGNANKGLRYAVSSDAGQTWNREPIVLLPETNVTARYYSARTIPLDQNHVGTAYMNRQGVYFLKVALDRLFK